MFAATLFTVVKTWKKSKRPSADEWVKTMWYKRTRGQYAWRFSFYQIIILLWLSLSYGTSIHNINILPEVILLR